MNPLMKPLIEETNIQNDTTQCGCGIVFEARNLSHTFDIGAPNEYKLFDNFNLVIEDKPNTGEIISLMGGSGCGKSCILKMASGLMTPQKGEILINCKTIKEYGHVPMVFQSYSSYEWMTVLDNVALPLVIKGTSWKEARERVMDIIKIVGLEQHYLKYAKSSLLSGGQLQRISIARCLSSGSKVFFLDEATGALDIKMKREIQDLILNVCHNSDIQPTIINVTHGIEEALYISDKIIVLKPNPCSVFKIMDIKYGEQTRGRWVFDTPIFGEYSKELSATLDEACQIGK